MKPILFHPGAKSEAMEAASYYESSAVGVGARFTASLENALKRIELSPGLFPIYKATVLRRCLLRRFPYVVFFMERASDLWVIAIAHTSRQPGYWSKRLRERAFGGQI